MRERRTDWVQLCLFLRTLLPSTIISRNTFAAHKKLHLWRWAVRERSHGQVDGRSRRAPWLAYSAGQTAATVLATLPAWGSVLDLAPMPAAEVAVKMREPAYRDGAAMWQQLYAQLLDRLSQPGAAPAPMVITTTALPFARDLRQVMAAMANRRPAPAGVSR